MSVLIALIITLIVAAQALTIVHAANSQHRLTKKIEALNSRVVELEAHSRGLEVTLMNTAASIRNGNFRKGPTVIQGAMDLTYQGRTASMQAVFKPNTYL